MMSRAVGLSYVTLRSVQAFGWKVGISVTDIPTASITTTVNIITTS